MKKKISNWQEIKLSFFLETIFPKFWNHEGNTENQVIEFQSIEDRAFLGANIKEDMGDPTFFKLGFITTYYSSRYHSSRLSDCNVKIFLAGFLGSGYASSHYPFWYNIGKDGKPIRPMRGNKPDLESLIRVRILDLEYFQEVMKSYVESNYKIFPTEFTKNDYIWT